VLAHGSFLWRFDGNILALPGALPYDSVPARQLRGVCAQRRTALSSYTATKGGCSGCTINVNVLWRYQQAADSHQTILQLDSFLNFLTCPDGSGEVEVDEKLGVWLKPTGPAGAFVVKNPNQVVVVMTLVL